MDAQVGGEIGIGNNTTGNTSGNTSVNISEYCESCGGGGWFPSPEEIFFTWVQILIELAIAGYVTLLKAFNALLGTPYPENDGWLGAFGEPTGRYQGLYEGVLVEFVFPAAATLIVITLVAVAVFIMVNSTIGQYYGGELIFKFFLGLVLFVLAWNFVSYLQQLVHLSTMAILPSAHELTKTPAQTMITMGGQLAVIAGVAIFGAFEGLILVLIYAARQAILFYAPIVFPVLVYMAFLGPHEYIRALGSLGLWQYFAVLVYPLPTAVGLRMAYEMNWAFSANGVVNAFLTLGLVASMILWPLVLTSSLFFIPLLMRLSAGKEKLSSDGEDGEDSDSSGHSAADADTSQNQNNPNHQTHVPGMVADGGREQSHKDRSPGGSSAPLNTESASEIRQKHRKSNVSNPSIEWDERTRNREWSQ